MGPYKGVYAPLGCAQAAREARGMTRRHCAHFYRGVSHGDTPRGKHYQLCQQNAAHSSRDEARLLTCWR